MIFIEVAQRFRKAKAVKRRYMVVCFDAYDRMRGDEDLGYYYPMRDSAEEVREFLEGKQLGDWDTSNLADCCEAVIDLEASGEVLTPEDCRMPQEWLEQTGGG